MIEVFRYQTEEGDEPLTDWLHALRDKQAQAKIRVRHKRLEAGSLEIAILLAKECRN